VLLSLSIRPPTSLQTEGRSRPPTANMTGLPVDSTGNKETQFQGGHFICGQPDGQIPRSAQFNWAALPFSGRNKIRPIDSIAVSCPSMNLHFSTFHRGRLAHICIGCLSGGSLNCSSSRLLAGAAACDTRHRWALQRMDPLWNMATDAREEFAESSAA
jgi:hypothetical protein